jgi:leucyl-tRNA synthetase
LQFFKKGLAYKSKSEINWCPSCKIGLANEEVIDGKCERCGTETIKKEKEQWMLGITKYAERLDKDLDLVDYPERVKLSQRNWIGKSEGSEIEFEIKDPKIKRFILLHGRAGSPDTNFFPWLKKKLENLGYEVFVPSLPNPNEPDEIEQADYVIKNFILDKETVILGHSSGGLAGLKILESNVKIAKLILLGTPHSKKFLDGRSRPSVVRAIERGFNFEKIKRNCDEFFSISDSSDHIVPAKDGEYYASVLNTNNVKILAKKSHFVNQEEPELLNIIIPKIKVFTTRADTLFGATYVVLAPEYKLVEGLKLKAENKNEVEKYISDVKKKSDLERTENKIKTGVLLKGVKAINPANGEEIPIWIADYVLPHYGTGAVMAVPAHDERDFEFAKKYKLPIRQVITDADLLEGESKDFYDGEGILVYSGQFDYMNSEEARKKITEFVGGKMVTKFKLRDWVFSRQRYWGEPIPIIHCEKCGEVPVPEKDLPVKLPAVKSYKPTDTGESPLAGISKWVNVKCPKCKGKAKRETDTMPNWAGSSWYYLRYADPKNKKVFADQKKLKYWLGSDPRHGGVNWYNGGMEHTTLHLLYSRFWHKFLYDLKLVPTVEPYKKRTSHGMILGEGGVKMSKSLGNVVNPDEIVKIYGADTLRIYEMFLGPFEDTAVWNTESIIGSRRFIEKVWRIGEKLATQSKNLRGPRKGVNQTIANSSPASLIKLLHKTIKKVSEDIETMHFNTAISAMMILATEMEASFSQGQTLNPQKGLALSVDDFKKFLQILAPFAPHTVEELWNLLGEKKSINFSKWPVWDEKLIKDDEIKIAVQVNGKVRAEIMIQVDETEEKIKEKVLQNQQVLKFTISKEIKKVIYVKNRLINIVV